MISDLQSATFVLGIANLFFLCVLLYRELKKREAKPFSVTIGGVEKTITEYPYVWDFKITKLGIYKITINTKELTN